MNEIENNPDVKTREQLEAEGGPMEEPTTAPSPTEGQGEAPATEAMEEGNGNQIQVEKGA